MFKYFKAESIKNSKVKKYFLYALGEITLVVIGILIALQVNNSNIASQKKEQEIKILKELNDAFISDTTNLKYLSERLKYSTKSIGSLIEVLSSDQAYNDSLDIDFALVVTPFMWSESNSAYKTLLSKGMDIISNDEIRNDIISIHTSLYEMLKYIDDGIYVKYPYIHEYCLKHFDRVGSESIENGQYRQGRMKPNNYEMLKADPEYHAILKTVKSQQEMFLAFLIDARKQLRGTIDRINKEIDSN